MYLRSSLAGLLVLALSAFIAPVWAQESDEDEDSDRRGAFILEVSAWSTQPAGLDFFPASEVDRNNPFNTSILRPQTETQPDAYARLGYEFISYTYKMRRKCHRLASNMLHELAGQGVRRVVFYGAEPLAEVAALSLDENNMELVAIADEDLAGEECAGRVVVSIDALDALEFDRIVFTKFSKRNDVILHKLLETKGQVVNVIEPETSSENTE